VAQGAFLPTVHTPTPFLMYENLSSTSKKKQWESGHLHVSDLLEQTGLKEATFYRRLREYRLTRKK